MPVSPCQFGWQVLLFNNCPRGSNLLDIAKSQLKCRYLAAYSQNMQYREYSFHSQFLFLWLFYMLGLFVLESLTMWRSDRGVDKALSSSIEGFGFDLVVMRCEELSHVQETISTPHTDTNT